LRLLTAKNDRPARSSKLEKQVSGGAKANLIFYHPVDAGLSAQPGNIQFQITPSCLSGH